MNIHHSQPPLLATADSEPMTSDITEIALVRHDYNYGTYDNDGMVTYMLNALSNHCSRKGVVEVWSLVVFVLAGLFLYRALA